MYYTGIVVDINNDVGELSEDNNGTEFASSLTIVGPGRVIVSEGFGIGGSVSEVLEDSSLYTGLAGRYKQTNTFDFTYQWFLNGVAVDNGPVDYEDYVGPGRDTYFTFQRDVGGVVTVEVTYTDVSGDLTSYSSAGVTVQNVDDAPMGEVFITSDAQFGEFVEDATLTINVSDLSDEDGLGTLSYQWYAQSYYFNTDNYVRSDIAGATGETFILTQAEVGAEVSVEISYVDGFGTLNTIDYVRAENYNNSVNNVDDPTTGNVVLTGTAAEDQILTADVSGLVDEDGLTGNYAFGGQQIVFSYTWYTSDGQYLDLTESNTFQLTQETVGRQIYVEVEVNDDFGGFTTLTSAPSAVVQNVNDAPEGNLFLEGTPEQGSLLFTINQTFDADGYGFGTESYQWSRDGVAVAGATFDSYVLTQADVNAVISVTMSYTDADGTLETVNGLTVTPRITNVNDMPEGAVVVRGVAAEDAVLRADISALSDADGLGALSYQWLRDGQAVAGATGSTLALTQADAGGIYAVEVSYTDGFGMAETVTSNDSPRVFNVNDAPTGTVTLGGSLNEGGTLRIIVTNLADADGLGALRYDWFRDGVAIQGEAGDRYVSTQADVGAQISATVRYVDAFGTTEVLTTPATTPVPNVNDAPAGTLTLAGFVTEGGTIRAISTLTDEDGLGEVSYQWLRDGSMIAGANAQSYVSVQADVGASLSVTASYVDGFGTQETVTSIRTTLIRNVNDAPVGSVLVTGDAITGAILTAAATLADEDGLGALSYQWLRGTAVIAGAICAGRRRSGCPDLGARFLYGRAGHGGGCYFGAHGGCCAALDGD